MIDIDDVQEFKAQQIQQKEKAAKESAKVEPATHLYTFAHPERQGVNDHTYVIEIDGKRLNAYMNDGIVKTTDKRIAQKFREWHFVEYPARPLEGDPGEFSSPSIQDAIYRTIGGR
jgi:hypothetical protein